MSQANNIHWLITDKNIELLYNQWTRTGKSTRASSLKIGLDGQFADKGIIVTSTNPRLAQAFLVAFPNVSNATRTRNFYHTDDVQTITSRDLTEIISATSKPAIGLYNPETQDVFVMEKGGFNYGFVNAMVIGFLSKLYLDDLSYQYAHAASFSINGKGLLVIGDHKAGKSTLISKILSEAEMREDTTLGIASDDWVLLGTDREQTMAFRLSEEYRIDQNTIRNSEFRISSTFNALMDVYKPDYSEKASIPIAALCAAMSHQDLPQLQQDKIVLLDPMQEKYMQDINMERALDILSMSTANVPPLNAQEFERKREFWYSQLKGHDGISMNNRYSAIPLKTVASNILNFAMR